MGERDLMDTEGAEAGGLSSEEGIADAFRVSQSPPS